jgi:zinc protease
VRRLGAVAAMALAGMLACASAAAPAGPMSAGAATAGVAPAAVVAAASPPTAVVVAAASPAAAGPEPDVSPRLTPDAPFRQQAPAAGPEPTFRVPAFKRFKLKSGLEVFLAESHDLPLLDLHMVVKTGGAANPAGAAGLADLTANMLDEGTKTRSAIEIADRIGHLGAALATGSSWDASTVTLSTLTRNLDDTLEIWADVIAHPAFADKEFARVRDNLLTAVSRRKDSPPTVASLVMARVLYGDKHPFGWPQAGVEDSLRKLTVADVKKFYDSYYAPRNAAVIAAGDITESELRKKLDKALSGWKPRAARAPAPPAAPTADKRRIVLVDKPGAPQSSIRVGIVGLRRSDPNYFPVLVMNQILGGSFYRLDMNLRERQQWTYGARSTFEMRRTPGPMSAGGEFVAAHTSDAVGEILKEMKLMATADVTDEELARAKDNFIKAFPARFSTRGGTAGLLAELAVYGLPDRFLHDYTKKLDAVTKADVKRVAAKYLPTDKMSIVVVGDRASQEAELAKLAPVELRDLDGNTVAATAAARETGSAAAAAGGKSDKPDRASKGDKGGDKED